MRVGSTSRPAAAPSSRPSVGAGGVLELLKWSMYMHWAGRAGRVEISEGWLRDLGGMAMGCEALAERPVLVKEEEGRAEFEHGARIACVRSHIFCCAACCAIEFPFLPACPCRQILCSAFMPTTW